MNEEKINITYVMLGAFVVLIAMLYAGIHSALKAENEWQQQMEDYEEDYKKAVEAVHAENYATAVDLLEKKYLRILWKLHLWSLWTVFLDVLQM